MASDKQPRARTRNAAEMFPLIEEWEGSDLKQKDFCAHHRIKPHIFWYWLRRYREEGQAAPKEAQGFVSLEMEVKPVASVLAEVIYPDGTRLVFKERVELELLQGLLPKV